ncbi:nucleolar protein 8-like isoform X1 [Argonauta hians]
MEESKRLFIGGLFDNVTESELADRFRHFGKVSDIEIRNKKDESGRPIKTFAYININTTSEKFKSCMKALNCTKWRSHILNIEIAKPSFYHKLLKDIAEQKKQQLMKATDTEVYLNNDSDKKCFDKIFHRAKVGSEVPEKKDWVIVKYGRALPVMRMKQNRQKVITINPSKYCYSHKKFNYGDEFIPEKKPKFSNSKQRTENKAKKSTILREIKVDHTTEGYPNSKQKSGSKATLDPHPTSKDCKDVISSKDLQKLTVLESKSKDDSKPVSETICIPRVTSKNVVYNDSSSTESDNLVSCSVSKGKSNIDSITKESSSTKQGISKKAKNEPCKSKITDTKKVNSLQDTQNQSTKSEATTKTKTLKESYVNSKVLQKYLPTKGSRGLILRAKPSLLLKYKAIKSS